MNIHSLLATLALLHIFNHLFRCSHWNPLWETSECNSPPTLLHIAMLSSELYYYYLHAISVLYYVT